METLIDIIDKKACSGAGGANTGKLGCLSLFGEPTHFILIDKGMVIPKDTVFDLDYLTEMVQKGKFVPLIDAAMFEDQSAEDAMSTNSKGIERLNLKGLPKYKFGFEEGHEFYREISKLTGYKSKDVLIGDESGNWMMARDSSDDIVGFQAGQIVANARINKVSGGDAESKSITMQFLNRPQFDTNYGILHAENLTWTPQEVPLVNGVSLAYTKTPATTDTEITVKAVLASDMTTTVEGLVIVTDWLWRIDGETVVVTNVEEIAPGIYTLTIPEITTNDNTELNLFDSAINMNIINADGILFRSNELKLTIG